jgi:hypothetical protein
MSRHLDRRYFIGGSDARVIMGNDEAALVRLWREKRGELGPEDLSDNLIVQLGGCGLGRGVRSQVHVAVGVLGRGGDRETYGAAFNTICGSPTTEPRCCRSSPGAASVSCDPLYQHLLMTAEKKFWRCVQSGETPRLFGIEPPRPRLEAVRTVDMSASNS